MKYEYLFPSDLLENAVDLISLGVKDIGWYQDDVQIVLDTFLKNDFGVLGGDILELKEDNLIKYTLDSWYIDKKDNQNWTEYVSESVNYASERIGFYCSRFSDKKLIFNLVVANERDYPSSD